MPFPRRQTLTAASIAARRRNAQKSTGPRTSAGKARVALNALKHGLASRSFLDVLKKAGEAPQSFDNVLTLLGIILQPRNRLEAMRMMRYAQMLWSINRRSTKLKSQNERRVFPVVLSKPESVLQQRIIKDLNRASPTTTHRERRLAAPLLKYMLALAQSAGEGNN